MQEYQKTDEQIHWLSQVIARVNRAYVPEKEDDGHTSLSYDAVGNRLLGRWIGRPDGNIILSLNLHSLSFEWMNDSMGILDEVPVLNRSIDQIVSAVALYPGSVSLDTARVYRPLHFEIPDYGIESLKSTDVSEEGIRAWSGYRDLANRVCQDVLSHLQADSEVRIWPHHFDTGIYSVVNKRLGLGFGLAMKDPMVGMPYFYMAGYGKSIQISDDQVPLLSAGHWETGASWKGAVLPLYGFPDPSGQEASERVRTFIREAISWYIQIADA